MIALLMKLFFAIHKETFFSLHYPHACIKIISHTSEAHTKSLCKESLTLHGLHSHNSFWTQQEFANNANKLYQKFIIQENYQINIAVELE